MKLKQTAILLLLLTIPLTIFPEKIKKIIGLMHARNEENMVAQSLKALAPYTDAIVFLDDVSTDNTLQIVQALKDTCKIERIIEKKEWFRDEAGDRNKLLQAAREIGGTHMMIIDADELFTANCQDNDFLRKKILQLKPGEKINMNWIHLWRNVSQWRNDNSKFGRFHKTFIFADDSKSLFNPKFIHAGRIPHGITGKTYKIPGYEYGVLHFQFVNWHNLLVKQAWYRCLERIRQPKKPIQAINALYAPSKDESNIHLSPASPAWFKGYDFFDPSVYDLPIAWREEQLQDWFNEYGTDYFAQLDIWDIALHIDPNTPTHTTKAPAPIYAPIYVAVIALIMIMSLGTFKTFYRDSTP